jgi:nucleotide-binding universal stress UspA family protein
VSFTLVFLTIFMVSEHYHEKRRRGAHHQHLDQFNQQTAEEISPAGLGLTKPYRKLVSIRSTQNLFMLEKSLAETDPLTTDVIVMTAKVTPEGDASMIRPELDSYDQQLMTAVVQRAEKAGKKVKPLIVPTNNPLFAIIRTASDLKAQEMVVGASNKYTADEQLEQIAFYWINMHEGQTVPLTVRILGRDRDVHLDLAGGNRIPKLSERQARSVAELRAAGVGVDRVLLVHDGSPENSDLFQAVLTMLDPQVVLTLVSVVPPGSDPYNGPSVVHHDEERARHLARELKVLNAPANDPALWILNLVREGQYDLLILGVKTDQSADSKPVLDVHALGKAAPCRVFLALPPAMPAEPEEQPPAA